jgi:amino acid transporter
MCIYIYVYIHVCIHILIFTSIFHPAAAETEHPRKVLPDASKQVTWRIILFYFVSLLIVGFLVPYDSPDLLGGGINTSAFVVAISTAGVTGLPDFMNFIILISNLSVGNSAVYGASRAILALVDYGQAPKILGYVDRAGRPMVAVLLCLIIGIIGFVGEDGAITAITFQWLLAISGLSSLFTWGSIMYCHIRFREAWALQGRTVDELPFTASCGTIGSWIGLLLNTAALGATFYVALFPIGGALGSDDGGKPDPKIFFLTYLAALVVVVFWFGYMVWGWEKNGLWHVKLAELDLNDGMKNFPPLEVLR